MWIWKEENREWVKKWRRRILVKSGNIWKGFTDKYVQGDDKNIIIDHREWFSETESVHSYENWDESTIMFEKKMEQHNMLTFYATTQSMYSHTL